MGCHTWFFRPTQPEEIGVDYCDYGDDYVEVKEFADLFRTSYTETVLHSLKETLDFCKSLDIHLDDLDIADLTTFWEEYPNGIIEFG